MKSFRAGIGVRALALDSKGNVWVASNMDLQTPQPKLPEGISIMEQFKLITEHMVNYIMGPPARITGAVNMIRPDGSQPAPAFDKLHEAEAKLYKGKDENRLTNV